MRIDAAIQGNLEEVMRQELDAATAGVQRAVRRGSDLAKGQLRAQVKRAGLGDRLAKSWQNKDRRGRELFWPNEGLNPAAMVKTTAGHIITAHMTGALIRARNKRFLAIPTEHALRIAGKRRRMRISPRNWPGGKGRLRYVKRRNGPDLLILEEARLTKAGRVSVNTRTKKGSLRKGTRTLVMFVLVPMVKLKKRPIDIDGVAAKVGSMLPAMIVREYEKEEAS